MSSPDIGIGEKFAGDLLRCCLGSGADVVDLGHRTTDGITTGHHSAEPSGLAQNWAELAQSLSRQAGWEVSQFSDAAHSASLTSQLWLLAPTRMAMVGLFVHLDEAGDPEWVKTCTLSGEAGAVQDFWQGEAREILAESMAALDQVFRNSAAPKLGLAIRAGALAAIEDHPAIASPTFLSRRRGP